MSFTMFSGRYLLALESNVIATALFMISSLIEIESNGLPRAQVDENGTVYDLLTFSFPYLSLSFSLRFIYFSTFLSKQRT